MGAYVIANDGGSSKPNYVAPPKPNAPISGNRPYHGPGTNKKPTEEWLVLNKKTDSYKGTPVVWQNNGNGGSFSIAGRIFLNENVANRKDIEAYNLLKHEYGHTVQEKLLGADMYIKVIAIPSVVSFTLNQNNSDYYSQPWERTADMLGGVDRGNYLPGSEEIALRYLIIAKNMAEY